MREFDVIVIGSGSGLDVASAYTGRGKEVAVIEPGPLGGTCLDRGCIPSKMLIHHADIVKNIKESEDFHIDSKINNVNFQKIIEEVNNEVTEDSNNIEEALEASDKHTLYREEARFTDEKVLEVEDEKITAEKIIVAAGSRPMTPPIEGLDELDYLTSKDALKLNYCPKEIVMIGGGYISLELAYFYSSMGSEVTILEMGEKLLKREDREISKKITELAEEKYNVHTEFSAKKVEKAAGRKTVIAENKDGVEHRFKADEVLVATGRVPNTDKLEVKNAGLEKDERGFLEVDEYLETNVDGIYALGDIAGNYMFKHSANLEAEHVFKNSHAGNKYPVDYTAMPHAVFTDPQIAGVGKTEQELEEENEKFVSVTYDYSDTGMGMALKEEDGFVKVLAAPDGEILGCHIIGPEASTLIHEVLVAMKSGNKNVKDIKDTVHIHPALNEVVQRAFNTI
ncbi:dihydrolipoyl dehydrogenase [Candidatus Nanohalobium constans]|uniref:Pyruvate/2-oxoglutarate dehydrogenase complex, dihydrolipoamide dehydrogenase (E3) component n=1 Tax=Candidatus Nanohalobium constans TaxID=2565781 RepID=A0A5Q0UG12_9ARCH|nr:dihydrolipoyl dehydrogenase [Candidatus Nanohalobium constans]QGA80582.1 pyruvate/2-oxoglutarate dehydrogenase complex, dihydrolipoamide dehydrogenase (E3) component [Candidatus Nanohalobium constans]